LIFPVGHFFLWLRRFSPLARRGAQVIGADALRLLLRLQEPSGESASRTGATLPLFSAASMPASKWGILWPQGLDQVRIIQKNVPEPPYHLAISPRLICNHKLDGAQRGNQKRVAAILQRGLYGGRTEKFP
jgi:hypothetical protein